MDIWNCLVSEVPASSVCLMGMVVTRRKWLVSQPARSLAGFGLGSSSAVLPVSCKIDLDKS